MDKNTITGFVLIGIVLFAFSWFNQPSPEQLEAQRRYNDSIERVEAQRLISAEDLRKAENALQDSVNIVQLEQNFGSFASVMTGESETVTLENELFELRFNTKGGNLSYARLKEYDTYDGQPLVLFDETQTSLNFSLITADNKVINTSNLYFKPILSSDASSLTMRLDVGEESFLDFTYFIKPDDYRIDFTIQGTGMNGLLSPRTTALDFEWKQTARQLEKGRKYENQYTTIYYNDLASDFDYLSETSDGSATVEKTLKWVGYKNKFFSTVLISSDGFEAGTKVESRMLSNADVLKDFRTLATVPFDLQGQKATSLKYYIGPNSYQLLNSYDKGIPAEEQLNLEVLVPLGASIFRLMNKYFIIPIFNYLGQFFGSYGLIIFLLTVIVKTVILPLTYKSYISSAKMRVLRPQVEAINAKLPGQENAMERQRATMDLYSQAGASPMSGCIPMLLQMPILIALYMFFPSAIELRHESFLWAQDLSTYDAVISWDTHIPLVSEYFGNHISLFCVLMTVTNVVYTKFNMQMTNTGQQQMPGMKMMMYLMPVMMLIFLNQFAAGLNYYYFISLLITIIQTVAIRYFIDEEKLLAKLEANKQKPKKKSSFMRRLEEAQKAQEEQLRKQRELKNRK
jgi:membrane protein insertase, YidC/Oxa1 family, N-terminal domain